jgi:hypothetical protein
VAQRLKEVEVAEETPSPKEETPSPREETPNPKSSGENGERVEFGEYRRGIEVTPAVPIDADAPSAAVVPEQSAPIHDSLPSSEAETGTSSEGGND